MEKSSYFFTSRMEMKQSMLESGRIFMIKKGQLKKSVLLLTVITGLVTPTTAFAKTSFKGEYRQGEILSFGSSLNSKEEAALRDYFGVSDDMEAIYVDNEVTIKQLGLEPDSLDNYTGGWYSSAHVKLTDKGGVNVSSNNVSLVTNEMFANALITSGILNCEVTVSAPFMVTGESALAGILAGAEEIMGEGLSEQNKVVAKEEIDTTLEIADEILNNEENDINSTTDSSTIASGIINDIKQQVIKDSPNSTQIGQIILNVTNNYGVELSEESTARIQRLMEDVNDLEIDYKDIKDTMKNIGNNISEHLKEAGVKLKESGILERIGDWFVELFRSLGNWLKELFVSSETLNEGISDESNGELSGETELPSDPESGEMNDFISETPEQPSNSTVNEEVLGEASSSDSNHVEMNEAVKDELMDEVESPWDETVSHPVEEVEQTDNIDSNDLVDVDAE